jgi:hypothetical protein
VTLAAVILAGALAMPQPWGNLVRRDHIIVMGMPGCGKTPFAASLAAPARRVVSFDPTGEWSELGEVVPAALFDEHRNAKGVLTPDGARALAAEFLRGTLMRVVVVPDEETLASDFEATVAMCRAACREDTTENGLVLLVDEVGDLTRDCTETLQGLHRNGHKDGIATILASPCCTDFPKRCRDTASRVFSFFQKNHADRRALADEYGEAFATAAAAWRHPSPPAAWLNPTLHA